MGRHHARSNFLLDVGESTRFDLQRGKSFPVRGTKIEFSRACTDSRARKGHGDKGLHLASVCRMYQRMERLVHRKHCN